VRIRDRDRPTDALRRIRRSSRVARAIPLPLRIFDLTVVALALPFVLVIGAILALAVFLDSPGPILYRSSRIGRGGQPFDMLKFRTMVRNAGGPLLSARSDERYTPLGRTLAYSRLDELPQLWNVILGEMRLVGPRPELADFVRDFPDEYERILSVPPGLTGPAQLEYAWEGEILERAQAVDRARMYRESILPLKLAIDLEYASRHSVRGDLVLLAKTVVLPLVRTWHRLTGEHAGAPRRYVVLASAAALCTAIAVLVALVAVEASSPL
jgi:lipopolysaccharide/colanic/teichoic acid biosynthesis glycosyltransferase